MLSLLWFLTVLLFTRSYVEKYDLQEPSDDVQHVLKRIAVKLGKTQKVKAFTGVGKKKKDTCNVVKLSFLLHLFLNDTIYRKLPLLKRLFFVSFRKYPSRHPKLHGCSLWFYQSVQEGRAGTSNAGLISTIFLILILQPKYFQTNNVCLLWYDPQIKLCILL